MNLNSIYVPKKTAAIFGVVVVIAVIAGLYFGGVFNSSRSSSSSSAPTVKLPRAATKKPTISTGSGAVGTVKGYKLSVQVSSTPEIQSSKWAVMINVQGGVNRSQTLGSHILTPGKPFIVSNNGGGAYSITPSILNCSKNCSATASGYTLPPLTVPSRRNATITVLPKCVKTSKIALGIDCSASQVLFSYK